MKAFLVIAMILAGGFDPASAMDKARTITPALALSAQEPTMLADAANNYPIKPSEAAAIAQRTVPDSKVLNVKLLPSGEYVVTLKAGGSVQKVTVNATTGATS